MEIFPVWRDLFFEYQGDVLEYRITIKGGDEIFHGRAVKSPKDRVIRIRLNDCCESYLNSLLGEEAFREAEEADKAYPMDAYGEFALDVIEGDSWETAYEWAFTNDYSYEYKEPQGSYSEPINGHSATGQLLPYSHLVTGDTESVCYDGCGGIYFTFTSGEVMEYSWGGAVWRVRWDTNLDSVYYVCSDGTTGTISNKRLNKTLPRNYSFFKQQYTVRFYDRQGGTLLGTAVATVDAVPDADPDPVARAFTIISYPSVITNETTAVTVEYSISDNESIEVVFWSGTTAGTYSIYDNQTISRNTGVNTETFTIPANTEADPVYYRFMFIVPGLQAQNADITQLGTHPEELYLTIEAIDDIGLRFHRSQSASTMQNLEYSTDKGVTWSTLPTSVDTAVRTTFLAGTKVWLRGNGALEESWLRRYSFLGTTGRFNVYGNVMSLIFGDDFIGRTDATVDWGFNKLFQFTDVVSARQLVLPSLSLGEYAYEEMFWECSYLTAAPELPATTLATSCYVGMFRDCSSLTTAPALPATTLAEGCYTQMFGSCTALTTAPELPATTLGKGCYQEMFYGCTSLAVAPELPAIALVESCYSNMFLNCTSLTAAPVLPAMVMAKDCYNGMFNGCTSLTTAPALPSTNLGMECYAYMFKDCSSLTSAPALPATALTSYCYTQMFLNCTSLTNAPDLPAATLGDYSYSEMFSGCTSLNHIKCLATNISRTNCTRNWLKGVSATGTFIKASGMSDWTTGNNGIPSGWTVLEE